MLKFLPDPVMLSRRSHGQEEDDKEQDEQAVKGQKEHFIWAYGKKNQHLQNTCTVTPCNAFTFVTVNVMFQKVCGVSPHVRVCA